VMLGGLICAIVHRDTEVRSRRNFLEEALLAEMSMRDGLTGLMNRRALDEHLLRLWQQGLRDRRTLAVLMIDIDHFKSFNDLLGHQAGDAVLRSVSKLLKDFAQRPLDIAARYGGEEFVVALYDMQREHVQDIAERIRHSVESMTVPRTAPIAVPNVTVSIGAAVVQPALGRTLQGALQSADEALYQAKERGRNRLVLGDTEQYRQSRTGFFRRIGTAGG
jgi:diguanylate cyclase (GGDEF)-like protein